MQSEEETVFSPSHISNINFLIYFHLYASFQNRIISSIDTILSLGLTIDCFDFEEQRSSTKQKLAQL